MGQRLLQDQTGREGGTVYSAEAIFPDNGPRTLFMWGTFDSARIVVEISPDGKEWFRLGSTESKTSWALEHGPGVLLHVGVENPGPGTRLNAEFC